MNNQPAPRLLLILPIVLMVTLGVFYAYGLTFDPNKSQSRLIGKAFPIVTLPALSDTQKDVSSLYFKTPAIINIWASWCSACRAEHELLMEIAAQHHFFVYGVDYQDDLGNARAYLKAQGNPFDDIMFDGAMASAQPFDVLSLPQTYLIDQNGIVRARHVGKLTKEVWEMLKATLNQREN
ncbi:MAG: thiol:disulfide interchange protein DsbE [Pseudomonadota bacterium]|jgi:cytochrome c biogenesis protein CcmG/thiol:disulfide interchange protein DsbE